MNKEQGNHFQMHLNVQGYMDEQTVVWSKIPRIVSYKNDFDALLTRISEVAELAQSTVAVTERKNILKKGIGAKCAILSGAMQAFAYEKGDMDLVKKVSITRSVIEKMKEQDIDASVKSMLNLLRKNLEELADYGVNEQMAIELETTLEDFNALIGKPRTLMNKKYVALDTLDKLFTETNELLKNKMDKLMLMFKETENGFYDGYERSRVIVDR